MRIIYLTWGEVPRLSSVFGGQVVEVVSALQRHPRIESAKLISGYPVIHSGMVREKWRYHEQLSAIRKKLGVSQFATRRIPVPPVGVHPKPWQLRFFLEGHRKYLMQHVRRNQADVVQCRSYIAALLALETRARYKMDFKVVFDARSLMPEEAVVAKRWSTEDPAFAFWKDREREILIQSDLSVAVSQPMQDRFDVMGARRSALIHLNVAVDSLDAVRIADVSRLDAGEPVVAYCGYLAENTWHSPTNLWRVFASFRVHCPGAKLLVVTRSNHAMLRESIMAQGMSEMLSAVTFTATPSPRETVQSLQDADLSVLSYRDPGSAFEIDLAECVFATKSAEYLAVGLPLLVNRYCGGARDYALSHHAGLAYDPRSLLSAYDVATLLSLARDRTRISQEARDDFGLDQNADRLVRHYEALS